MELIAVFNLTETLPRKIENISGLLSTSARSSMTYILNKKHKNFNQSLFLQLHMFPLLHQFIYFLLYDTIQPF